MADPMSGKGSGNPITSGTRVSVGRKEAGVCEGAEVGQESRQFRSQAGAIPFVVWGPFPLKWIFCVIIHSLCFFSSLLSLYALSVGKMVP